MISSFINWRTGLALLAILIVSTSIVYSQYLANKIAEEEKQKVEQWVEASKAIVNNSNMDLTLPNLIRNEQTSIPIIETNEKDSIVSFINIDTLKARKPGYLESKLRQFKSSHDPVTIEISKQPYIANKYYYGSTQLLNEVRFYPILQLCIVSLFIILTITSIATRNRATQNQVWAGMAKETAHQLGTPITSLQGWLEMLKENPDNQRITTELEKDINRLKLVSDRFGKIGSTPQLEPHNILEQVEQMMEYIRKRAAGKVSFALNPDFAVGLSGKT
jgi:signal transduction histidine kinase